jgi:hypothetical protein
VEFELSPEGVLTFTNIAVDVKAAQPATEYRMRWFAFDNQTGTATPVGDEAASPDLSAKAPAALLGKHPDLVMAELRGTHPQHAGWATPLKAYFRRQPSNEWQLVGVERQP